MALDTDLPDRGEPGHSVFVHDFAPLDVGFAAAAVVVSAGLSSVSIAASIVGAFEIEALHDHFTFPPLVLLGPPRWRDDAVIVPMTWQAGAGAGPSLEADLEVTAYTETRSHLHLLGRAALPADLAPGTRGSSLFGRQTVAVVRHVLDDLALAITARTAPVQTS